MAAQDEPSAGRGRAFARKPQHDRDVKLDRMLSPGERVPQSLPHRERMEQLFRAELGQVRAYSGAKTLGAAGARAAADGETVAFAETDPSAATVAHEVTHVLQSRGGGSARGDAEAEASRNQAAVARGAPRVEVTARARGVHYDQGYITGKADLDQNPKFLASNINDRLAQLPVLDGSPWGHYITSGKNDRPTVNAEFADQLVPALAIGPTNVTPSVHLAELVEPESLDALVLRGAGGFGPVPGAGLAVSDGVYWEVTNAIARRVVESLPRVLPYIAQLKAQHPLQFEPLDTSPVPARHPMDRAVAAALGTWLMNVDKSFYTEHPEVPPAVPAPRTEKAKLAPAGGELWHWVIADPADSTAAEVAIAMFGNADLQHRLVAMPPRWGFHHADLDRMDPDLRKAIHEFAAAHHPHPAVLNFADVYSHHEPVPVKRYSMDRCAGAFNDPSFALRREMFGEGARVEPPAPAPIYGLPKGVDDPVLELMQAERTPLPDTPPPPPRHGKAPLEQHDELELSEKLSDADRLLGQIVEGTRMLALATDTVQQVRDWLALRRAYAVKHFLGHDVDKWYRLTSQQIPILRTVAYGFANLLLELRGYAPANLTGAPGPDLIRSLPEFTRAPMQEAGRAYVEATQGIDLPEVARARARIGDDLTHNVTVETLERGLHASEVSADSAFGVPDGPDAKFIDPYKEITNGKELTARLAKLRLLETTDPAAAAAELTAVREQVSDYQFTAAILQAVTQLNEYWNALDAGNDFWTTFSDTVRTGQLEIENRMFYDWFYNDVFLLYTKPESEGGSKPLKAVARANFQFMLLNPRWKQHFKDVEELLDDEQSHRRWLKLIAAITICIASMWVGGEVALFVVEDLGWSAGAAAVANVAADTATGMYLNYTVLGVKPTVGSTVAQVLTFGGMAALQRVRAVARVAGVAAEAEEAIKASFLVRAGRATVDFAKEAFVNVAVGQASNLLANRIDTGSWIDADTAPEAMVDGAITAVALTIAGRLHGKIMEPRYRAAAKRIGIDLDDIYVQRKQLIDEATQLKGSTDREAALDVVDRMNENLEREEEQQKKLEAIAKTNPKAFKDAMGDLAELAKTNAATKASQAEVTQARSMISVEDLGPGLARADSRELDAILARHRESGGRVIKVETDPNTNLRTVTLETATGGRLEIREKPLPASERTPPKLATETSREFEKWLDDPARDPIAQQRLRDLYVVDPEAAVALARDHGYDGPQPEHPVNEAARGRDAARKLDDPQIREMTKPDFSALERAGYRYDPVARRFVPTAMKSGIHPDAALPNRVNEVIGKPLPSEAVGHAVLQLLGMGDVHALRVVGIEPPPGFESSRGEWGLGRRSDGAIVLVRGEAMGVQWSNMPGVEPLAHSHPFRDNRYFQIGGTPDGKVALGDLVSGHHPNDTLKLFPSGADFLFCAAHGLDSHFVYTPYVDLGNGMIGNPRPGGLETPITIEIRGAATVGSEGATGAPTATAEIVVRAGDKELMRRQMWGSELGHYMPVRFQAPTDLLATAFSGPKPGSTFAPAPIDDEQIARITSKEGLDPKLKDMIETDPRVRRALHNEGYDEQPVIDAWADFTKRRAPSDVLASKTFGEYLSHRSDFHTAEGGPPKTVEEVFPSWQKMGYDERQWAIVRRAEPDFAAELEKRGGKIPKEIKKAIKNVLDNRDVVAGKKNWDDARHAVMTEIDAIVSTMAKTPAELETVLGTIHAAGRIGTIGEQYVERQLTDPSFADKDLVRPRFSAEEIRGLKGVKTFSPDRIVTEAHRSLDIKTGYGDTTIDLQQAENYKALIDASITNPDLAQRLGGPLAGHDYLFLPGGDKSPQEVAAAQYEALQNHGIDMNDFRCLYLGENGGIFEYRPGGDRWVGDTIHGAMFLKSVTP